MNSRVSLEQSINMLRAKNIQRVQNLSNNYFFQNRAFLVQVIIQNIFSYILKYWLPKFEKSVFSNLQGLKITMNFGEFSNFCGCLNITFNMFNNKNMNFIKLKPPHPQKLESNGIRSCKIGTLKCTGLVSYLLQHFHT